MGRATLSVIMCNYNHGRYLEKALRAILDQSFKPLEVIVVDDGSTDNSAKIINELIARYPALRLIGNEKNMGVIYSADRGMRESKGEYLYFAAADDRVLPGFFEKSMALLTDHPQAGLCCSDPAFSYGDGQDFFRDSLDLGRGPAYLSPRTLTAAMRRRYRLLPGHTSIVKKTDLIAAGGYLPALKWHCDWFAHYVAAFRKGICYVPEPLAVLRVSQKSYSAGGMVRNKAQFEVVKNMMDVLKTPAYRDVQPLFVKSKILSIFGLSSLRVILKFPEHRDFFSFRIFWYAFERLMVSIAPHFVKELYRSLRFRRK